MREAVFLALVHHPTVDREGKVGATAVTTLDLHDLARLAKTYGLGGMYATTPLEEQRALVGRLLDHWIRGHGGRQNPCRREALLSARVVPRLEDAVEEVERSWDFLRWSSPPAPGPARIERPSPRSVPGSTHGTARPWWCSGPAGGWLPR